MTEHERLTDILLSKYAKLGVSSIKQMADYLIDQGIFAPPCKVGDKVYIKSSPHNITECTVYNICTNIYADNHDKSDVSPYWVGFEIRGNDIGKTVFLTREEAEKALKESEKDE